MCIRDRYKGTANAIYQNIGFIDSYDPEYVIILSALIAGTVTLIGVLIANSRRQAVTDTKPVSYTHLSRGASGEEAAPMDIARIRRCGSSAHTPGSSRCRTASCRR